MINFNEIFVFNRLMILAEDSSREAFESVNSIVRAFQSITFMMESTFNAIYR